MRSSISARGTIVQSGLLAGLVACAGAPWPNAPVPVASVVPAVVAPPAPPEEAVEPARPSLPERRPAVPSPKCVGPSRLVQRGTVHDNASFRGEVLASGWSSDLAREEHSYDPETLAPAPPLPPEPIDGDESGFVTLVAGLRVESDGGAVTDVATGRVILQVGPCAAGGFITFELSNTGRYLVCDSNRAGLWLWDLRSPHPDPAPQPDSDTLLSAVVGGPGWRLSPNDVYAVDVPVFPFAVEKPSGDTIRYYNLERRRSQSLSAAPALDRETPYDIAFCGDGSIFAVSGEHELTIYRGSDGKRLAGAPAKKGGKIVFSASGRYLSQARSGWTTVYKLIP